MAHQQLDPIGDSFYIHLEVEVEVEVEVEENREDEERYLETHLSIFGFDSSFAF